MKEQKLKKEEYNDFFWNLIFLAIALSFPVFLIVLAVVFIIFPDSEFFFTLRATLGGFFIAVVINFYSQWIWENFKHQQKKWSFQNECSCKRPIDIS